MWKVPYDPWSVAAIAVSAAAFAAAASGRRPYPVRVALVLLAAAVLRIDAAWQWSLYPWDERFHALVAKHMLASPLTPVLYPTGHLDANSSFWLTAHVWLHKPPFAMWAIAASYALFGVNELALRLPSVVVSVAGVGLSYRIGALLFTRDVGLLAAAFHAVNGFLIGLTAGRRVADHVDVFLIFFVELGAYAVLSASLRRERDTALACGAIAGLAVLTKSMPGMLPLGLLALAPFASIRRRTASVVIAVVTAAVVATPWFLYARFAFPSESAVEWTYIWSHVTHVLEGQGGPWWSYLADTPRFFGELVPVSIVGFALVHRDHVARSNVRVLVAWLVLPYAAFSMAATKLPNLVMIAAPPLFLMSAAFWVWLHAQQTGPRAAWIKYVVLALLLVLPARHLLEPTGPLEARDRNPPDSAVLRGIDARLGRGPAVVFNVSDPVAAMFYSRFPCYGRMPTIEELAAFSKAGVTVGIVAGHDSSQIAGYPGAIVIR
jgi:4-amino-4-deoxy-L-arabinose transferase